VILIIGYGNSLRGDDGLGQRVAGELEHRLNPETVHVLLAHQLTPELVEPIRQAKLVVFIDARVGETPGTIFQEVIQAQAGAAPFTHNMTPASLLAAAQELYGAAPTGILISIVGAAFDYGGALSSQLNLLLPTIVEQVVEIVEATG
jgi:hydrogenase maturation protease